MSERVPEGWKISQLGNLATVNWGNTTLTKASYVEEGFPAFSAAGNDGLVTNAEHHSTGIVLSAIGARCGRTFLTPEKWTAIKNTIAILTDDQDIRYLYHVFNFDDVWNKSGGAQPFISLGDARKTPILHPPLPEQKKIASILTSVDEVIETAQKQIDKLQDLKKATMNELLTKGIGHTEFKDSELGRIPKSWEVAHLGAIGNLEKGKGISKKETSLEGVPCIRYAEIYTEYDFVIENFKSFIPPELVNTTKKLKTNDIIFAGSGETVEDIGKSVAFVCDRAAYVGGDSIVFSPAIKCNSVFLSYQLNDDVRRKQLRKLGQGSSVIHVYASGIEQLKVALPPISEQNDIAKTLRSYSNVITAKRAKLAQTQCLKKSLMQDLLTGKVRVKVN